MRAAVEKICSTSWVDPKELYYASVWLDLRAPSIPALCQKAKNELVSQATIDRNKAYVDSLDSDATVFISSYVELEYSTINEELRSDERRWYRDSDNKESVGPLTATELPRFVNRDDDTMEGFADFVRALDGAPASDRPFWVFRETSDRLERTGVKAGDTFVDQAITSTSWKPSYGFDAHAPKDPLPRGKQNHCCLIAIRIPRHVKVLFIEALGKKGENEVLTYPGAIFKVLDVTVRSMYNFDFNGHVPMKIYQVTIVDNFWFSRWGKG